MTQSQSTKKNNQIIIPQKMSNTGSIYDLASDLFDRTINMRTFKYAVILPAYFGGRGYTRHKSFGAALQQFKHMCEMQYYPSVYDHNNNDVSEDFDRALMDI